MYTCSEVTCAVGVPPTNLNRLASGLDPVISKFGRRCVIAYVKIGSHFNIIKYISCVTFTPTLFLHLMCVSSFKQSVFQK